MKTVQHYEVSAYDDDPHQLTQLVLGLLRQNLQKLPRHRKIARAIPRPVAVHDTDTGQTTTVVFYGGRAELFNDLVGRPSVVIKASGSQLMEISQLRTRARSHLLTGLFTRSGAQLLARHMTRKLVVKGLLTHTATALNFVTLISVAD